jgi:hypothetical protein
LVVIITTTVPLMHQHRIWSFTIVFISCFNSTMGYQCTTKERPRIKCTLCGHSWALFAFLLHTNCLLKWHMEFNLNFWKF